MVLLQHQLMLSILSQAGRSNAARMCGVRFLQQWLRLQLRGCTLGYYASFL